MRLGGVHRLSAGTTTSRRGQRGRGRPPDHRGLLPPGDCQSVLVPRTPSQFCGVRDQRDEQGSCVSFRDGGGVMPSRVDDQGWTWKALLSCRDFIFACVGCFCIPEGSSGHHVLSDVSLAFMGRDTAACLRLCSWHWVFICFMACTVDVPR